MAERTVQLNLTTAAKVLRAEKWQALENLKQLAAGPVIGYSFGPEYAFAAIDNDGVRRLFLVLRGLGLICCDVADGALRWSTAGADPSLMVRTVLVEEGAQVHAVLTVEAALAPISNLEVVGVRAGKRLAAFHRQPTLQNSALHFEIEGKGKEKVACFVAGLAPGLWEIWWNGYLEEIEGLVRPETGTLYFDIEPGSVFIRRP